jgi:O-antigen/teichoic acid export membrane protein
VTPEFSRQVEFFKRAKAGFLAMSVRSILIFGLQSASVLVLAQFLNPNDYGLFGILNGWVGTLMFFTDIGVGGALVHQQSEPTDDENRSYLGLRIILAGTLGLLLWSAAPFILDYYRIERMDSFRWIAILLPLGVLSSVQKVQLQRQFMFAKSAGIEFFGAVAGYSVQILSASLGLGAWSMIFGSGSRSAADTVVSAWITKKITRPSFKMESIRRHLNYGIFFQMNSMVPVTRGILLPMVAGSFLSVDQLGYVFWIAGLVGIPVVFANNYNNVFFPVLARLRDNESEARAVISNSVAPMLLGLTFVFGLGATVSGALVPALFNSKWYDAIPFIPWEAVATGLIAIRFLGNACLLALGRPQVRVGIETATLALEVPAIFVIGHYFQFHGYYYGLVFAQLVSLALTVWYCRRWLAFKVYRRFFATATGAVAGYFVSHAITKEYWAQGLVFSVCFFVISIMLDASILNDIRKRMPRATRKS